MLINKIYIILFFALHVINTNNLSSCRMYLPDGIELNLSKLRNNKEDYSLKYGKNTYLANFCRPIINK